MESSSTLGYDYLAVKNNRYTTHIDKPCGPDFVCFLFFDTLVQEPLVGGRLVEIVVLFV